ncbi:hypothetical protein [Mesorhizobium sp. CN2-181]|uniref:hypothetical protein n=1 Tax=Mesorhizobium yinganensis TaxID=3157707 RepID=UPI0032B8264C
MREYLHARRSELAEEIGTLRLEVMEKEKELAECRSLLASREREMADVDRAASAIQMVNRVQTDIPKPLPDIKATRKGTIKDYVVQVLSDHPGGLVALDILAKMNERFGTEFERTSLSPQLTRLKNDEIIDRRGMVWHLLDTGKDEGPDDNSSGPSMGDVSVWQAVTRLPV